jgi:hypothetical protein
MKRRVLLQPSPSGTGIGGQLPIVTINVRSRSGALSALHFCVDSGADLTTIPIDLAEEAGIAIPRSHLTRGRSSGLTGTVEHYRSVIHLRMFDEDFSWPCVFVEGRGPASRLPYAALGRAGFASAFNACIADPHVTIERRRDHLPAWQRFLLSLVPSWARDHPWDEPL